PSDERRQALELRLKQQDQALQQLENRAHQLEGQLQAATRQMAPVVLKKPVEPAPEPHLDGSDISGLETGAAAGLLLTAMGGLAWLYHRRRRHQAEQGLLAPQPASAKPPFSDNSSLMLGQDALEVQQQVDWLAEAEVFQSYGRYDQAIASLRA